MSVESSHDMRGLVLRDDGSLVGNLDGAGGMQRNNGENDDVSWKKMDRIQGGLPRVGLGVVGEPVGSSVGEPVGEPVVGLIKGVLLAIALPSHSSHVKGQYCLTPCILHLVVIADMILPTQAQSVF